jgi:hypothetical protein
MAEYNKYLAGYPLFSGHRVYMPVIEQQKLLENVNHACSYLRNYNKIGYKPESGTGS